MKALDLTLATPAENLACEEALLDAAEAGESGEILRFWESPQHFVVVGYANKVATEVNVPACEARGVPILRRCSGGGTVLQGPGCLNYALILRITEDGPTHSIHAANQFIMERNRAALARLASDFRLPTSDFRVCGHTDLAIGGRKFSGNSQRRRRDFLLFHGTFLLNFDLTLISELLLLPSLQPDYRGSRSHAAFVTNLNCTAAAIKPALMATWNARERIEEVPHSVIQSLARTKYEQQEWNFKF
jgi:lipoate---protein ligase